MSELKSCGVLIVRGEPIREFLLMKHTDRWDLPKGHVDPGETEIECALRELAEETGIRSDDVALDPDFRFELIYDVLSNRTGDQWRPKSLVIFLGRLLRETEIVVTEHLGYQWFEWRPPHDIQSQTINPLLSAVEEFVSRQEGRGQSG